MFILLRFKPIYDITFTLLKHNLAETYCSSFLWQSTEIKAELGYVISFPEGLFTLYIPLHLKHRLQMPLDSVSMGIMVAFVEENRGFGFEGKLPWPTIK